MSDQSSSSADARNRQARLRSQRIEENRRSHDASSTNPFDSTHRGSTRTSSSTNPFHSNDRASTRTSSRSTNRSSRNTNRSRSAWEEDDNEDDCSSMSPHEAAQMRIQRSHQRADDSLDRTMAKLDETLHTGANTAVQLREQTGECNIDDLRSGCLCFRLSNSCSWSTTGHTGSVEI